MSNEAAKGPLTTEQLELFHQDGYLVVPNVLDNCQDFVDETLRPHLQTYDWKNLQHFTTGDYDPELHTEIPGAMLRNADGSDPLSDNGQAWILENETLMAILHQLHDSKWEWLHPQNVGWIHVRLLVENASQFEPRWHVDGGHFSSHYVTSPEQSVIVLPMLHHVEAQAGNTLVLPKSHHYMAQLLNSKKNGVDKSITQDCRALGRVWPDVREIAPCRAGDVLLLHPLVVHAAGFHTNPSADRRITFNMGVKWTRKLSLEKPTSWLEASLKRSLEETIPKVTVEAPFRLETRA